VRRTGSVVLLVMAAALLPIGLVAGWARDTIYDSTTFSDRAVAVLDSPVVRNELAQRLTEQLVLSGNQEAVNFRPGLELAIQAGVDTDSFRSIFRTAVRRTHQAVITGHGGAAGLNLADSVAVITSTLQLPGTAAPGAEGGGLGSSLTDVTSRMGRLGVWKLDDTISAIAGGSIIGAAVLAGLALALATDRRRCARRLGSALVVDGLAVLALLFGVQWWASHQVHGSLGRAIGDAIFHATSDLRLLALWLSAYGVVVVAAASSSTTRYTPSVLRRRVGAWIEARRRSRLGTVALGVLVLAAGVTVIDDPSAVTRLLALGVGLWVSYLGGTEILRVARAAPLGRNARTRWRRSGMVAATVAVLVVVISGALVVSVRRAARRADAAGQTPCNGEVAFCDLRLDQVVFPGTHNSMSSSLYPGFLFGEQINTIKGQLNSGIRALLIDTHYGVPSTLRVPGSDTPLVLTDRAAELATPPGEDIDQAVADRAARLAARAPRAADAAREIYLCHNYCELGAVSFSGVLTDIKDFLDRNPDEVLMTIIQDATTPQDTADAVEAAGLGDRVATLHTGQPLPTLGELIDSGRRLVVFAEQDGPGAPAWYQPAYDWFQETPYNYRSTADFTCRPNRGSTANPFFLMNHWVTSDPPDPGQAAAVNSNDVLRRRISTCVAQRGVLPTVVAVNFSEKGNLISTVRAINRAKLHQVRTVSRRPSDTGPAPVATPRITITVGPSPTVPAPDTLTSLTGGTPDRFCAALPAAVDAVVAWANTILGEGPPDNGLTDLAYGPVLVRELTAYVDAAPIELGERARPLLSRAQSAVAALRDLGYSDAAIGHLADEAATVLSATGTDPVEAKSTLVAILREQLSADRLDNAAIVFGAGQPDPATLLDLGYVPDALSEAAGFRCSAVLASF